LFALEQNHDPNAENWKECNKSRRRREELLIDFAFRKEKAGNNVLPA